MSAPSNTKRPAATQAITRDASQPSLTGTPLSAVAAGDDPPTPTITFTTLKNLVGTIYSSTRDALRMEGVTLNTFSEILRRRSESQKFRVFFSKYLQLVIVTMPRFSHEVASRGLSSRISKQVWDMGLDRGIMETGSTTFGSEGPGEADESFIHFIRGERHRSWPSVVIQAGSSHSTDDLRLMAAQWLLKSEYAVKAVILVKLRGPHGDITLEKWRGVEPERRTGATTT